MKEQLPQSRGLEGAPEARILLRDANKPVISSYKPEQYFERTYPRCAL